MDITSQHFTPVIVNLIRYFLVAGIPFLIFYKLFQNKFVNYKIQARFAKQKDFIREILHSVQSSVIIGLTITILLFTSLKSYFRIYNDLNEHPIWWVPVSVLLALIIHDTYFYWMHRAVHHPALFKTIHLVHHKSVNPSPWTSYSFHFFEAILEALIVPIILFLLPIHPIALITFGFSSFVINVYGHLGYEIAPKWLRKSFLFEILNTSVYHNLHHEKFKGNYGLYFRWWDRIMGTECKNYISKYDKIQASRFNNTLAPTRQTGSE